MTGFMPENKAIIENKMTEEAMIHAEAALPQLNANNKKNKKKRVPSGFFRAVLRILSKKSDEKGKKKDIKNMDSNGYWKKIVGSMRPLHVRETPRSPLYPLSPSADDFMVMASPAASSSCGTMSRYASAVNLCDLDNADEVGDPDEVFDALTGDEMIDAKAEEFIAQFYRQIQLQNNARYDHGDTEI